MTTTNIKQHIIPYIGETTPYISIPDHIILKNNKIETELINCNLENENFSNLLKTLASLGSCSLYQLLNNTTNEKIYFLGEKLRIRKTSYKTIPNSVSIVGESKLESKRRGKSYLTVKDLVSEETLYTFELDYYIIPKETFKVLYKNYFEPDYISYYDEKLPKSKITQTLSENQFVIDIDPFTTNQCKGHFENYPIVPFVFVTNCILREIFNSFSFSNSYEIDSLEGYPLKAIPIHTQLKVDVFHQKFLKDLTYFKCEIKDYSETSYAVLIIHIKSI
ncbi:hypothetical protein [Chryseobacterium sp. PMSZPI]|uniref:hypothetical protein n=1 Tax=Chryseobacterium sp. PMSZPI TaxID=1033900 RepID=UPI000C32B6E8|nr:hypothetical protein [Chryseobacterium sp. PMSZPI]PKF74538.1 hypothetical protein CW752_08750 [Chryseobacterium sp. PMSZPI]